MVRVALDAMGGDYAPVETVKGAVEAVQANPNVKIFLVGQEKIVREELSKYQFPAERMEVVPAMEVITN